MHKLGNQNYHPLDQSLEERYQVLATLDRGGMSVVYKAKDKVLNRVVAIKTIETDCREYRKLLRFQSEAKAISGLRHEGIVRLLDFGVSKTGQPYLVLNYLEGESITRYLERQGIIDLSCALEILLQVLEAIDYAHEHGVLHRDLKSSNIIVSKEKSGVLSAKVIDFGIAIVLSDPWRGITLSPSISIIGSPYYMSPEQISERRVDARAEIYSLGCVLFEMITGRPPFTGASALLVLNEHLTSKRPDLPKGLCPPLLRPHLDQLVDKALDKDVSRRFQSIQEFHQAICELLDHLHASDSAPIALSSSAPSFEKWHDVGALKDSRVMRFSHGSMNTGLILIAFLLTIVLGICIIFGTMTGFGETALSGSDIKSNPFSVPIFQAPSPSVEDMNAVLINSAEKAWYSQMNHESSPDLHGLHISTQGVNMSKYNLDRVDLAALRRLPRLRTLSLSKCDATATTIQQIKDMQGLLYLDLSQNRQIAADGFCNISTNPNLSVLDVELCNLMDEHIESISKSKSIAILKLGGNPRITGRSIALLTNMPLISLDISGSFLSAKDLEPLQKIRTLEDLKIDYSRIEDEKIEVLKKMKGLKKLSLSYTTLTVAGLRTLIRELNLEFIKIKDCRIKRDEMMKIQSEFPNTRVLTSTS